MIAKDMHLGRQYKLLQDLKNRGVVKVVEYDRPGGGDGKFAIVHARGELDMQSCFGIPWTEEVEEVPETTQGGKCPACGNSPEPTNNPHNPVCCRNDVLCSCGWMGKLGQ